MDPDDAVHAEGTESSKTSTSPDDSPVSASRSASTESERASPRSGPVPASPARLATEPRAAAPRRSARYEERRRDVLRRRHEHHHEFLEKVRGKWQSQAELEAARIAAARASEDDGTNEARIRDAWGPPLLLVTHFLKTWQEEAERIRATNNLKFFLLPLIVRYLSRLRKRIALRKAMQLAENDPERGALTIPTVERLRHSSPMIAKWPRESLRELAEAMHPRFYFPGNAVFLTGELAQTSFVHFVARGAVSVADPTEAPVTREQELAASIRGLNVVRARASDQSPKRERYYIEPGSLLGENSVVLSEAFSDSYLAVTEVVTYAVESAVFQRIVQRLPSSVQLDAVSTAKSRFKRRLQQSPPSIDDLRASHRNFFTSWNNDALAALIENMAPVIVRPGEKLFRDERTSSRVMLLVRGEVSLIAKHTERKRVGPGITLGACAVVPTVPPDYVEDCAAVAVTFCELWSASTYDVAAITARHRVDDKLDAEFASMVRDTVPRPGIEDLRKTKVFAFLAEKPAHALIDVLQPRHVRAGTVLAREDAVVKELVYVAWGTLQLEMVDSRTKENVTVGELGPGSLFGSAECIASATTPLALIAPHSTIVCTCSDEDVLAALEAGGHNVLITALERANQLVGSRSAEARNRMEAEYARAAEQAAPQFRVEDARRRAAVRALETLAKESVAASAIESKEMLQRKATIQRLTEDAKRARELQKLAVEHRVFACIKDQVYGGRRNEHTTLVSEYYSRPMDAADPHFIPDSWQHDEPQRAATGSVFVVDEYGGLARAAPKTAETAGESALPALSASVASFGGSMAPAGSVRRPVGSLAAAPGSPTGHADAFITETSAPASPLAKRPLGPVPSSTASDEGRGKFTVSDPLPYVQLPAPPSHRPPVAVPDPTDVRRRDRMNLLANVGARAETRRKQHTEQLAMMFSVPPMAATARTAPKRAHEATSLTARSVEASQGSRHRDLPAASRIDGEVPGTPTPEAEEPGATPRLPPVPRAVRRPAPKPEAATPTRTPDMAISVDPSKHGRAVGAGACGKLAKGKAGGGVVPRARPPKPLPASM